jgi:hypothetical protein
MIRGQGCPCGGGALTPRGRVPSLRNEGGAPATPL